MSKEGRICLNCGNNPCTCGAQNFGSNAISAEIVISGKDEIAKLQEENLDLKEKLTQEAELQFQKAKEENNVTDPSIDSTEKLEAYLKGKEEREENNKPREPATGKAPLTWKNPYNKKSDLYTREFESPQEMVDTVRALANEGDLEAQAYLKKLTDKALLSAKGVEIDLIGENQSIFGINEMWEKRKREKMGEKEYEKLQKGGN